MFKKVVILIFLVLLISGVFAIRLVDPISKTLIDDDYVGSTVAGTELELIFSKEFGKFSDLQISSELPSEFDVRVEDYLESIKVFIKIPTNAIQGDYSFEVTMTGKKEETVRVYFLVEDDLLQSALNNYFAESYVNGDAIYEFSLINNSHADAIFNISAELPFSWTKNLGEEIIVPKKSVIKKSIIINPQISGEKTFKVIVSNPDNKKEFSLFVNSKTTLLGKNKAVLNGLPFYSISLAPSYFFNSIIASFFN